MRIAYQVLAFIVCALVAVQAATHAWASAGIGAFILGGGVIDLTSDAPPPFPEFAGIIIHGMNGMYVIPLVALVLLVVSFFAKVRHGILFAAIVFVLVIVQVTLGLLSHDVTSLALLHGANAILLFGVAFWSGSVVARRPKEVAASAGLGASVGAPVTSGRA